MEPIRCAHRRDVIGVRELIRALDADGRLCRGSSLTLRVHLEAPVTVAVHENSYPAFDLTPNEPEV
jgi:hypothetical protein